MSRLQNLRQRLAERELDALLISQAENRRYLSGFTGSAGFLLVTAEDAILATDFRYVEQAETQAPDFKVSQTKGEFTQWLLPMVSDLGARMLGFESNDLSFATYRQLVEAASMNDIQLIPTEGMVESLRPIKEDKELELITRAARLADAAIEHIISKVSPGMKERDVAWQIERFLRENGSEGIPFDVIVASGPNSALPHAEPTERILSPGEPIVIDLGARLGGYCSDMTRTICLGSPDETFSKIYDLVLGAQLTAIATIGVGMNSEMADKMGRVVIEQGGYGDAFGHGLGHGVGLAVHEEPYLGPRASTVLADGMVFTIEPGIYVKGWGGVRIEDTVTLGKEGVKVLTRAEKIAGRKKER